MHAHLLLPLQNAVTVNTVTATYLVYIVPLPRPRQMYCQSDAVRKVTFLMADAVMPTRLTTIYGSCMQTYNMNVVKVYKNENSVSVPLDRSKEYQQKQEQNRQGRMIQLLIVLDEYKHRQVTLNTQ